MNEAQSQELQDIRTEQRLLTARLAGLEQRLARIEAVDKQERLMVAPVMAATPPPPSAPVTPPPLPSAAAPSSLPARPISLAKVIEAEPATARPPVVPAMPAPVAPAPAKKAESLEMRIGTTWLVRAGIVLFVTFLAFLGSYLYKNIVPHLGPPAKVSLLYLGAGAVAGVGAWLERSRQAKESDRMRTYARVLLAGGLAGVYYVTYAAHYYDKLRIIHSPLLAGALLLGWASFMVWLSERRNSETLATVAILLGFYTSAINDGVPTFTLVSNLFLTAGAVFLLRRHLWRVFPFVSLLATFGSYAFWNYFHTYLGWRGLDTPPVHGGTRFWVESAFLLTYWLLFTWAAFTAGDTSLPSVRRAGFVSLNNGAFFLLMTWLVLGESPHDFWKWSLGFGVVLVALAEASRRLPQRLDVKTEGAYLVQGLLLVTLGFVTYFSGWQLSLVLAVQSVALLVGAGQRRSRLLLGAAYVAGLLSFLWAANRLAEPNTVSAWATGLSEGGFLVLAAWWSERLQARESTETDLVGNRNFRAMLLPASGYFSLLGLAVWLWLFERRITVEAWNAPVLAVAAVLLTASVYVLRVRMIPVYAQFYLVAAYVRWVLNYGNLLGGSVPPWWNALILLAATIALGHWWQRQQPARRAADLPGGKEFALGGALASVLLLQLWLGALTGGDLWIGETALLALALLGYGVATGYRALAAAGQWFLLAGASLLLGQWDAHHGDGYHPEMWLTLGPWLGLLLTLFAVHHFLSAQDRARLDVGGVLGAIYEVAATVLFLAWASEYFPRGMWFALFCLVGGGIFLLGVYRRKQRWVRLSVLPTATGLLAFLAFAGLGEPHRLADLLGVATLGAQQWWGRRQVRPEDGMFPRYAQNTLVISATLCAWILVTHWVAPWRGGAFSISAAWSIFAAVVFGVGLALRERMYRWLGLVILAVTLARIALVDIWRLGSGERVVSTLCLALTLMGLGYLYNRYHDKWQNLL